MNIFKTALCVFALYSISVGVVLAEPDVEELGQPASFDNQATSPQDASDQDYTQSRQLTINERTQRLERQIETLTKSDLLAKIEELQSAYQHVKGDLEKQAHDLQQLTEQQRRFYQDISQRLAQAKQPTDTQVSADNKMPQQEVAPEHQISDTGEHQIYRDAFELLKAKQYDQAASAFRGFISKYPSGVYTVNAYYWLGEIYYLQGKTATAKQAFSAVVNNYPNNQKMPDALLKLAVIEIDAGHAQEAKKLLQRIQKDYPETTASRLAAIRAQELKLST